MYVDEVVRHVLVRPVHLGQEPLIVLIREVLRPPRQLLRKVGLDVGMQPRVYPPLFLLCDVTHVGCTRLLTDCIVHR